jgi:HK97 family phage portal protein
MGENRIAKAWGVLTGKSEERSLSLPSALTKLIEGSGQRRTVTEDSAMGLSVVYAIIDQISSSLASLPLNPYISVGNSRNVDKNHDQYQLLKRYPGYGLTPFEWKKQMLVHALGWGNGLSEIVRDSETGRPLGYKIIHPSMVKSVEVVKNMPVYDIEGYDRPLLWNEVIHIRALSTGDYWSKSPLRVHAETISAALSRNEYSASMMRNGGFIKGIIKVPTWLEDKQSKAIRESWGNLYGGVLNAGKTPVLEGGTEFQNISIDPADAQMVETMNFTVEELARIYLIPPHKVGHLSKSSFSNIEQQSIEYVQDCLTPWAVRFEQALDLKIYRVRETDHFTKFELNALMRGDIAARTAFYVQMLSHSVYSPNEVRQLEDSNPVEGGDVRFVASNLIDLKYFEDFSKKLANEETGSANTQTGR